MLGLLDFLLHVWDQGSIPIPARAMHHLFISDPSAPLQPSTPPTPNGAHIAISRHTTKAPFSFIPSLYVFTQTDVQGVNDVLDDAE